MHESVIRMTDEIVKIMEGRIFGIWLYGSVVMGDFRLGWSDIDFIALTGEMISEDRAEKLLHLRQYMCEKEPANPYYRSFEGIIANHGEYLNQSFHRLVYWGTSGQRVTDRYVPDAFSRYELAKYGKQVYGNVSWPFPAPDREELIAAVRSHYDSIRKYAIQTDESLYSCGWLLDIARCIYTLRHNDVIAKTQAGIWALEEHLFADEGTLKKAIEIRQDPQKFKGDADTAEWLKGLGPAVQSYADVLERELRNINGYTGTCASKRRRMNENTWGKSQNSIA